MTVASEHASFPVLQALVEAGGDIESPNAEGQTLLMAVARTGKVNNAGLLLERGARVDVRNHLFEVTPLLAAAGVWRVYGIFREGPISGEFTTGAQALEAVQLLQAAGADIHARAANGQNAAHGAAKAGWIEVLQWAADQGIDLHARDVGGLTPRDVAQITGQTEAIAFLDRVAGKPPEVTRPALPLPAGWSTQDAILAFLPAGLDASTATADDLGQAATDLAFAMEGDIEENLSKVMVALGEMSRAGLFANAARHGEYSPEGRFYTKVMNLASSNLGEWGRSINSARSDVELRRLRPETLQPARGRCRPHRTDSR